ncbi:MAG: tetratricopeptide repeat protein [bacterium]
MTPFQKGTLICVLVLGGLAIANSAYLFVTSPHERPSPKAPPANSVSAYGKAGIQTLSGPPTPPGEEALPKFYQAMLLGHVFGGLILLGLAIVFVTGHVRRAWHRKNIQAIRYGVLLVAASVCLAVSGLFILSEANSTQNQWIFYSHRVLAVCVPLLYVSHRLVAVLPPLTRRFAWGLGGIAGLSALFLGIHEYGIHGANLAASLQGEVSQSAREAKSEPEELHDPFIPFHPRHLGKPDSPFFPSRATTISQGKWKSSQILTLNDVSTPEGHKKDLDKYGFVVNEPIGAETCARCHLEIVQQWKTSAHRYSSFNNPFYKASVENLREEPNGPRRSQWCGACHDPVLMFTDKMLGDIDPHWPESQAGLTCLACHAIDAIHGKTGNGNYNLMDTAPSPYLFVLAKGGPARLAHDLMVKSKPAVHKKQMLKPFHQSSEFCLTCHKVSLDIPINDYRWLRGQNEYDNWHDSGVARNAARTFYLPEKAKNCQDCHMPLEPVRTFDFSAKNGHVRSHRFLAVNTALPAVRGDTETIQRIETYLQEEKMRVDLFALRREDGNDPAAPLDRVKPALRAGETVQIDIVVRNQGVGHTFPGGTNDSNEAWIHFTVQDETGRKLCESGAMEEDGQVDPRAHFYRVIFVDRHSQPVLKRDPQNFHTPAYSRVIGPGTANCVRYRFEVPAEAAGGNLVLTAELLWRKFNLDFTLFVFSREKVPDLPVFRGMKAPDLPVTLVARSEVALPVVDRLGPDTGEVQPPIPPQMLEDGNLWIRYNDYGIAYLLQGDWRMADWAFTRVAQLRPDRVDGPRNRARVALLEGRIPEAYQLLEQCETLKPGDPQTAWFWGLTKKEEGLYGEAARAFERVLAYFPEDRGAWSELGRTLYLDGRYEESLKAYLEVLAIDPEDRAAHYHRMLCYRALGKTAEAAEAEKAYTLYQIDESAAQVTQQFRLKHPWINESSQPLPIYDLSPVALSSL